jgi:putative methyltransferase (TIGR04325 family)
MKQFIKSLIPPILLNTLKKVQTNKYGWKGNYSSWNKVQSLSVGYDSDKILQTVRISLLAVKNGEVAYERDGVIFDKIQYSWPLLAGLMYASSKSGGALKVCDFGGSLGSTYYQNKKFLDRISDVSWSVVEQKHFVDVGKTEFEDNRLKFYHTAVEAIEKERSNILLLSSVLQYIENPYELLDEILESDFECILIDRTPFSKGKERITLQVVPPSIYEASYPCRFFDKLEFLNYFNNKNFELVEEFNALDGKSDIYEFKGFILQNMKNV